MPKRAFGAGAGANARAKTSWPVREPGRGGDYEPFLTIHDLSSRGRSSRMPGNVPGRVHHHMSDNERAVFLALLYADGPTDIREQYRLDLGVTTRIAAEAGIRHPRPPGGDRPAVMTTDFVVTVGSSKGVVDSAIAVKPAKELDKPRVIEKLEIERRYWLERGVSWQICTDCEMTLERENYLLWLHGREDFSHMDQPYEGYWEAQCDRLLVRMLENADRRLLDLFDEIEGVEGARRGDGLAAIRKMLASKRIRLNGRQSIDVTGTAGQLVLPIVETTAGKHMGEGGQ